MPLYPPSPFNDQAAGDAPMQGVAALADEIGIFAIRRFYAWGAGQVGGKVARGLAAKGYEVLGFIDSSPAKWGQVLPEGEVFAPAQGLQTGGDVACVVTIWHYHHDFRQTEQAARALGFETVIHFSFAALYFGLDGVLPNYCIDHPRVTFDADAATVLPKIEAALADPRSREVFDLVRRFRLQPIARFVPSQDTGWPFDPALIAGLIDIGACVGEFCDSALEAFANLRTIHAYEPDPANFARLSASVAARRPQVAFTVRNAAVARETGAARFSAQGNWGSHISEDGGIEVALVSLDSEALTLDEGGFTLLKMDIEGAEMQALGGMQALLEDRRLIAMVTIEHRAQDLADIAQVLMRRRGCRLFLRAFDTEICMDTCYISVPEEAFSAGA